MWGAYSAKNNGALEWRDNAVRETAIEIELVKTALKRDMLDKSVWCGNSEGFLLGLDLYMVAS